MDDRQAEFMRTSEQTPEPPRHSRLHRLRTVMLAGLGVIAPVWITGIVLWTLFKWADERSHRLVEFLAGLLGYEDWYYRGIGFIVTFLIICGVGLITTNVLGRRLLQEGREALEQLPVVRAIYAPVHRLMEAMTSPNHAGFRRVVLFEYPRKGLWTLGFLAGDVRREGGGHPAHSVFVPTSPNPTTGFMLIIPAHELRHSELTVEEAFQMIVSAGVAVPLSMKLPADVAADNTPLEAGQIAEALDGGADRQADSLG